VGVHPLGSDAWSLRDMYAQGIAVGAPPDMYNQQGQTWNQPPWLPAALAASGYAPLRDMIRTLLRPAGAVRIDHVSGLFRLWWIPAGLSPAAGTYVRYDHEAMIGVLMLEAQRAGAVLIGNEEFGKAYGLKPRARIRATAKIGTDPTIMLTGPVPVTQKILKDSGLAIADIDLFEVNEAFASVVLRFMQAFEVDAGRVNVNGGAIALGHPLGATGAIIIGTLLDELERQDKTLGLATLCIASGMGAATIIERL
jgi:hypothetical protein